MLYVSKMFRGIYGVLFLISTRRKGGNFGALYREGMKADINLNSREENFKMLFLSREKLIALLAIDHYDISDQNLCSF